MILTTLISFSNNYSQEVSTVVPPLSTFDDGLSMDKEGNIFASRYNGSTVTKITKTGVTSIFASGISTPNGSDFGKDGYLYVPGNVANGKIVKISPSGVTETFIQSIPSPLLFFSEKTVKCTSAVISIILFTWQILPEVIQYYIQEMV